MACEDGEELHKALVAPFPERTYATPRTASVTVDELPVYEGPGREWRRVAELRRGVTVLVLAELDGAGIWYRIWTAHRVEINRYIAASGVELEGGADDL